MLVEFPGTSSGHPWNSAPFSDSWLKAQNWPGISTQSMFKTQAYRMTVTLLDHNCHCTLGTTCSVKLDIATASMSLRVLKHACFMNDVCNQSINGPSIFSCLLSFLEPPSFQRNNLSSQHMSLFPQNFPMLPPLSRFTLRAQKRDRTPFFQQPSESHMQLHR